MTAPIAPLFVPGNRPERFAKAAASGADAVIIDLEDAVAPEDKAAARRAAAEARPEGVPLFVRLNAAGTPWHAEDLAALSGSPAGILLPKAEDPAALAAIRAAIGPDRPLVALVESVRGLAAARELARGASRLAFGSIDYAADLGCAHTREALLAARSELVFASRLAGIDAPMDGVTATIGDDTLTEEDARHAAGLGFGGKLLIHPRQVAAALRGFAPEAKEVEWARGVLAAGGDGAVQVGGMMIDAPVRIRAERILARAGKG
ncbi:citrate lyase subunit beta / citryl-CoA lyase [Roseomonas rosea]|uniref:Citrate lyase subunit beta / citryl-CoA lyase n=1 Tax=Muricoccus roseus TaxID=198092 RepID=A0A1M6F250_9PROT|nr:CoA ester lyase [Roseomonas rosea]SHI91763.1 citrate lyase subunit beta / citryl-CoA lyase [Roseomonas rosea]